jgi:hypothetical protein
MEAICNQQEINMIDPPPRQNQRTAEYSREQPRVATDVSERIRPNSPNSPDS